MASMMISLTEAGLMDATSGPSLNAVPTRAPRRRRSLTPNRRRGRSMTPSRNHRRSPTPGSRRPVVPQEVSYQDHVVEEIHQQRQDNEERSLSFHQIEETAQRTGNNKPTRKTRTRSPRRMRLFSRNSRRQKEEPEIRVIPELSVSKLTKNIRRSDDSLKSSLQSSITASHDDDFLHRDLQRDLQRDTSLTNQEIQGNTSIIKEPPQPIQKMAGPVESMPSNPSYRSGANKSHATSHARKSRRSTTPQVIMAPYVEAFSFDSENNDGIRPVVSSGEGTSEGEVDEFRQNHEIRWLAGVHRRRSDLTSAVISIDGESQMVGVDSVIGDPTALCEMMNDVIYRDLKNFWRSIGSKSAKSADEDEE